MISSHYRKKNSQYRGNSSQKLYKSSQSRKSVLKFSYSKSLVEYTKREG